MNTNQARSYVQANFRQFGGQDISFLGQGEDFEVFLVGSEIVLRVPKTKEVAQRMAIECGLLQSLKGRLQVDLPDPIRLIQAGRQEKTPAMIARFLQGESVETIYKSLGPEQLDALADQLGIFYSRLHQIDKDIPTRAGVAGQDSFKIYSEGLPNRLSGVRARIPASTYELAASVVEDDRLWPRPYEGNPVLVHADLWEEHILLNDDQTVISGILDWADASTTDPARDFWVPYVWGGEAFLLRILESYELPYDHRLIHRAQSYAFSSTLMDLKRELAAKDSKAAETILKLNRHAKALLNRKQR